MTYSLLNESLIEIKFLIFFFSDPPISAVVDDKFFTYLDQPVTLRCDTDANPSATAWTWEYNGFNLDYNGKTYLVDMDSTSDIGLYYCIAYNEVGQSSKIEFAVELATPSTPSKFHKYFI